MLQVDSIVGKLDYYCLFLSHNVVSSLFLGHILWLYVALTVTPGDLDDFFLLFF